MCGKRSQIKISEVTFFHFCSASFFLQIIDVTGIQICVYMILYLIIFCLYVPLLRIFTGKCYKNDINKLKLKGIRSFGCKYVLMYKLCM